MEARALNEVRVDRYLVDHEDLLVSEQGTCVMLWMGQSVVLF